MLRTCFGLSKTGYILGAPPPHCLPVVPPVRILGRQLTILLYYLRKTRKFNSNPHQPSLCRSGRPPVAPPSCAAIALSTDIGVSLFSTLSRSARVHPQEESQHARSTCACIVLLVGRASPLARRNQRTHESFFCASGLVRSAELARERETCKRAETVVPKGLALR